MNNDHKLQQVASIYLLYQNRLQDAMAMDFDDIIMKTVVMLRDHEDVRERYRLYLITPPRKRHHRLNMEDAVKRAPENSKEKED